LKGEGQELFGIFVPRVRGPARIAEVEEAYQLGVRGEMGTITLITDIVAFVFHI